MITKLAKFNRKLITSRDISNMTTAVTTTTTTEVATTQFHRLHGPKPTPVMINNNSSKIGKKNNSGDHQRYKHLIGGRGYKSPVIVYLKSPEVVHVLPNEFMTTVQRLTGKPVTS
ncbi:hypothetical protein LXL04_004863 [Taraxacum kok-saghyz]